MNLSTSVRRLHADERGVLSMPLLIVFLGLMVCFSFLTNAGLVVSRKIETQNAADAVAYSTALQMARGMNAVTAANHLIGELHAITVLHHSFGGDELEGKKAERKIGADERYLLLISYTLAKRLSDIPPLERTYNHVSKDPKVGGAIGDARVQLQHVGVWAFITHSIGGIFEKIGKVVPLIGPFIDMYGKAVSIAALSYETKIMIESEVLDGLERLARATRPVKRTIETTVLRGIHGYSQSMVFVTGQRMREAVQDIGRRNGVKTAAHPTPLPGATTLPVQAEPGTLSHMERSQLTRASAPWVRHWRIPLMRFAERVLFLSRFKMFYVDHTNDWNIELVKRAKKERNLNLLIMKDTKLDGADKGSEAWTKSSGSRRAEELFSTVGFAFQRSPRYSSSFFRNPTRDGILTYAQGMIYNANPQTGRRVGGNQKDYGWDTLNWDSQTGAASEWNKDRYPPTCPVVNIPEPRIKLNWQAKLTPTNRLPQAAVVVGFTLPESRPHLRKLLPLLSQARTH